MIHELLAVGDSVGIDASIVGQGIIVTVIGWFMIRYEKKTDNQTNAIERHSEALDRMSKAILVQTMTHPHFPKAAESQVQEVLTAIEVASKKEK